MPRLHWLLGVVEEVFPGKDGLIRNVPWFIPQTSLRLHCLEMPEVSDSTGMPLADSSVDANDSADSSVSAVEPVAA